MKILAFVFESFKTHLHLSNLKTLAFAFESFKTLAFAFKCNHALVHLHLIDLNAQTRI